MTPAQLALLLHLAQETLHDLNYQIVRTREQRAKELTKLLEAVLKEITP
jgi:hypothetical protein